MSEELTFSMGETPPEVIIERAPDHFTMELVGEAGQVVEQLVNQGIDAHLEACFIPDRGDSYEWVEHKLKDGTVFAVKLHCKVSRESLPVLLRRMLEDDGDEALSLRVDILEQLDIEEV